MVFDIQEQDEAPKNTHKASGRKTVTKESTILQQSKGTTSTEPTASLAIVTVTRALID
jgi:hypothetical protein